MVHAVLISETSRIDNNAIKFFGDDTIKFFGDGISIFFRDDTIKALKTRDLAHLQMVNVAMKEYLEDGNIWATCLKQEMPQLLVDPNLQNIQRSAVMRCFACLKRTIISPTCSIMIENFEELQRLETFINIAARCAEEHRAHGGKTAHVLVGSFGTARWGASTRFVFRSAGQPTPGGLPEGCSEVKFIFNDVPRVGVIYNAFTQAPAAGVHDWRSIPFELIVGSLSPAMDLRFRVADLRMSGTLRPLENVISMRRHVGTESVEQPLLCVLALMDEAPQTLRPQVV
eukprot:TRINITY_DN3602_c0_g1_i2.p1 TRINITY_DN3602_c0_g1~~TRINITY_DN3602_c0_g1_i2.p1  ORF type:complete len:285 (+),score=37.80 TRINITY_DN3602_c0_g1_i2:249-1103(+)